MRFNKLDGGVVYNSVGLDNNEAAPIAPLSTLCASHVSTLTHFLEMLLIISTSSSKKQNFDAKDF